MSRENVEIVKRSIAAINERDVRLYLTLCAPDVELISPVAPLEGASTGAEGIRQFFAGLQETTQTPHRSAPKPDAAPRPIVLCTSS
jgi:ketosteroid isomerase-like protein